MGHNAIAGGFQGQRQWTDHFPNGDFMEAILNSSFDWNGIRAPYIVATENDCLNGAAMLLRLPAHEHGPDLRRRADLLEPRGGRAGHGLPARRASPPAAIIHLINSGAATLDGTGAMTDADGKPAMKPFWEITEADVEAALEATTWHPAIREYFRGGGYSSAVRVQGRHARDDGPAQPGQGSARSLQIAEGWTVDLPEEVHDVLDQRTNPTWPTTGSCRAPRGTGAFRDVYTRDEQLGRQPRRDQLRPHRRGPDQPGLDAAHPGLHAQRARGGHLPASAWANLGTADLEGADFRACANFGPLYGRK